MKLNEKEARDVPFKKCSYLFLGKACLEKWEMIPDDTDILITHTPPVGFGDLCCTGVRTGFSPSEFCNMSSYRIINLSVVVIDSY